MFRRHSFVKILTLFLVLSIGFIVPNTVHVNAALRIYSTVKETRFVEGVRHTRIVGEIDHNGTKSKQIINYVGANLKDTDINVVVGDNYADYGFGMSNIISQVYNVNRRLKDAKVIAGINGDFYNMSNGIPIMGFVRNFEVLFEGVTHGRTLIGFKDNGEVVFGQPIFEGYEVMVYNEEGELKLNKIKVNGFNRLPKNDSEVTVYFNEYESLIDSADQKMVIDATDIKSDGSGARYFGKGSLNTVTTDQIEVGEHSFVLMGDKLFEAGFITGGDKALRVPIENVEDSMKAAEKDLKKYKLNARDVVIGIAASGRTPYAIGGIEYANEIGCETACVTTSSNSLIASVSKYPIEAITGAEPVTGSTRMKSGTA